MRRYGREGQAAMILNDIWQASAICGLVLQSALLGDEWRSLRALIRSGRNGTAKIAARSDLEADGLRWGIFVILAFIGPHLPLAMLERWVAYLLIVVIWLAVIIAGRQNWNRRRLRAATQGGGS